MTFEYLVVKSPFKDNRRLFGNTESFPDLAFVIPNRPHPIQVHRAILAQASVFIEGVMHCKGAVSVDDQDTFEWPFEFSTEREATVIFDILRFFYGYTLEVSSEGNELCATLAILRRLQATCEDVIASIESFAVGQAKRNPVVGAQLLLACQKYDECCYDRCGGLHRELAKNVLVAKNMEENPKIIVDSCLMQLPLAYWDMATFGQKGTSSSEFNVWTRYLATKRGREDKVAWKHFREQAKFLSPDSKELKQAWTLGVFEKDVLFEMCFEAWSSEEKQNKDLRNQLRETKKREESWDKQRKTEAARAQKIVEENRSLLNRIQLLEEELVQLRRSSARQGTYRY